MPSFEADLEKEEGAVMQVQIGLQNCTINKGHDSLLQRLRKKLGSKGSIEDYIQICGLRRWQNRPSDGRPETELIYIHSKVQLCNAVVDNR